MQGGFAARKALKVVGHVETCIAIELLVRDPIKSRRNATDVRLLQAACQAIDFLRPLTTTKPLEGAIAASHHLPLRHACIAAVYALVRTVVKPWEKDRFEDFNAAIPSHCSLVCRYMAPDIEAACKLLRCVRRLEDLVQKALFCLQRGQNLGRGQGVHS